jgi:hypothetical protein
VTCNASDPEGDVLSYSWSAGGGDISGTGAIVNWTAPEEVGMYDITVVVGDSQGANATKTITLISSNGPPPVIEDVVVTADHKYLKEAVIGYKVGKAQDYHLACNASDPEDEELSYQWTCTAGNISGGSSNITWTAPDASGDVIVTVKVFDETGNWVRRSIFFEVVPCSPCTFG